ncbi:aromatic ring-hydroxylating oxygenase subunit alpha [Parafrankia elaeagni]|uniref:aromatic ring-hydroxylating oxygenase subunit alpha n=1 Tax=Parafrankia elaeagni TaxID=222534 RepID=UPI00036B6410|nr:SRPBCC family protein [Parafrankia elaeagni]
MTPAEGGVPATAYTGQEQFERERELVRRSPQLVGYSSELPTAGSYSTKTVMDVPVLLTRGEDGTVRAFQNICVHRQAQVASGCGTAERFVCPWHAWTYDARGEFVGGPGREGFPATLNGRARLTELPAAEHSGFLWVGLDPQAGPLDIDSHLGPLGPELASWGIGNWAPVGEKVLDAPVNWKLALDTFAESYHFATVHKDTFAQITKSNCALFDSYGPHHRLIFPMKHIGDLANQPEEEWVPLNNFVLIYALFPNIVLSVTVANGEIFRVYPGDRPGHSVTVHQNASSMDCSDEATAETARTIFDYAHDAVRDEDYALAARVQESMVSGARADIVFGRNEPGLHHRHESLADALAAAR